MPSTKPRAVSLSCVPVYVTELAIIFCGRYSFSLYRYSKFVRRYVLRIYGKHNILNALAALAAADALGLDIVYAADALENFSGVSRRFECRGMLEDGTRVIVDYAHHPDEIKASLETARSICRGKVIAVFEPHTYTRTASFADGFAAALCLADEVVLAPIYAAREKPVTGVCSQSIWLKMRERGKNAVCMGTYCEINAYVRSGAGEGDLVIYLGAGTINRAAAQLCVSP